MQLESSNSLDAKQGHRLQKFCIPASETGAVHGEEVPTASSPTDEGDEALPSAPVDTGVSGESSLQQAMYGGAADAACLPAPSAAHPAAEPSHPNDGTEEVTDGAAAGVSPFAAAVAPAATPEEAVGGSSSSSSGAPPGAGFQGLPSGSIPPMPPLRFSRVPSSESVGPSSHGGQPPLMVTSGKLRTALFQKLYRRGGSRAPSEASSFPPTPRTSKCDSKTPKT